MLFTSNVIKAHNNLNDI